MKSNFVLFGFTHWAIILSIPLLAWALARQAPPRLTRWGLGWFLVLNELAYYGYKLQKGWWAFPGGLPLQLCDLILWCAVVAALTLRQMPFEFAFFAGLLGTGMAILTPDLQQPWPSYNTVYFFLAHGGIITTVLYLWWSQQIAPRNGCVTRVMIMLNGYAAVMLAFNAIFQTNYMYLCAKPAGASVLDFLGPWPVYILGGELIALGVFWLLSLPFKTKPIGQTPAAP
jgi:hypothetical integral membrane protein (TIGR02206 family)